MNQTSLPPFLLHFVVALSCEAKPLIIHFGLKKISAIPLPYSIFVNTSQTIYLIVTGIGKTRVAAATAFLYSYTGRQAATCFFNIGIAGAAQFSLGDTILANKITEHSTGRCWYPFTSLLKNISQGTLTTHDLPQRHYPAVGMVDMEGAAFFQTASHFVTQEQVLVLKIISDNHADDQHQINTASVQKWLENQLPIIRMMSDYLIELSKNEFRLTISSDALSLFQQEWHFTHHQTLQLKEYLRRWNILRKNQDPFLLCKQEKNANHVINKIAEQLEKQTLSL